MPKTVTTKIGVVTGVFDGLVNELDLYTAYRVKIAVPERMMGGIPSTPDLVEAWLANKVPGIKAGEIPNMVVQTMLEKYPELSEVIREAGGVAQVPVEQVREIIANWVQENRTVGFLRDTLGGVFIPGRYVKAGFNGAHAA